MITLITMENILSPFFSLAAFCGILLYFHEILKWFIRIQAASCASLQSCLQYSPYGTLVFVEPNSRVDNKVFISNSDLFSTREEEEADDNDPKILLTSGDFELVMKRLGIFGNPITDQKLVNERLDSDDFSSLFDENEPSFEEVKEAFDVFDENKDGFIDAGELQKILCCLGLREGLNLKECERMIRVYDENSDGKIDFNEFVKFMEKTL